MNPRMFTAAALMSLAWSGGISLAAAEAQQAVVTQSAFEAAIAAARSAMMADPEAALGHARAAITASAQNPDARARLIEQATGSWLEAEALMRVNRPLEARPAIERGLAIAAEHAANTKLHADLLKARASLALVTGDVQPALADLLAAQEIYRALGERRSQAIVLQNLGSLYMQA